MRGKFKRPTGSRDLWGIKKGETGTAQEFLEQ
jgi:hypothetical protein